MLNVLGFHLPCYRSPTLLLSLGLSVRVLWHLLKVRPDVIHVSSPGMLVFAAILYAKVLAIPLVVSYHTHVPEYIPQYTWRGLVKPMWKVIQFCTLMADLTLVPSKAMKVMQLTFASVHRWRKGAINVGCFSELAVSMRAAALSARVPGAHAQACCTCALIWAHLPGPS